MSAKTSPPQLVHALRRERLFARLDELTAHSIAWITGPAGAGKSTLVGSYVEARARACIWYQLDAGDLDIALVFDHLEHALARIVSGAPLPRFGPAALARPEVFARRFMHAFCAALPDDAVIVFDNFHQAPADAPVQAVLRALLATIPRSIATIVISRTAPPESLDASGDVAPLGWDELKLTAHETAAITRMRAPDGAEATAATLHELSGGWPAALVLLLGHPTVPPVSPTEVHGSQALFDYFVSEVFEAADPALRTLLLRIAPIASVDDALAAQLGGDPRAPERLARLAREGFFTTAHAGSYQLHPLLRTFLLAYADAHVPAGERRELRLRAAALLAERGRADEAIELYDACGDTIAKADLIVRAAGSMVMRGGGMTVARWLAGIPWSLVEERAWLLYWQAVGRLGHEPARALELFRTAHARFEAEGASIGVYLACAGAIQAIVHDGGDYARIDGWASALERLHREGPPCPDRAVAARVATAMVLAIAFRCSTHPERDAWISRSLALVDAGGDPGHYLLTSGIVAGYQVFLGRNAQATAIVNILAGLGDSDPLARLTYLQAEALVSFTSGRTERCRRAIDEGVALTRETGMVAWEIQLHAIGADAALAWGDLDRARAHLEPMAALARGGNKYVVGSYYFAAGFDAFVRGDDPSALHYIEGAIELADTLGYPFAKMVSRYASAQILHRANRPDAARARLDEAKQMARAMENKLLAYACALVEAGFALSDDARESARELVASAFALGRECGFFSHFWSAPALASRVATFALAEGIERAYARELISRRELGSDRSRFTVT
jgi:ATP/maltotriose-dependent transcriptional regulator MalT